MFAAISFLLSGIPDTNTRHYQIELQYLNPNGIQHIAAFIELQYLGIEPHFELWRYFFNISLHKKRERSGDLSVPMG